MGGDAGAAPQQHHLIVCGEQDRLAAQRVRQVGARVGVICLAIRLELPQSRSRQPIGAQILAVAGEAELNHDVAVRVQRDAVQPELGAVEDARVLLRGSQPRSADVFVVVAVRLSVVPPVVVNAQALPRHRVSPHQWAAE